MLDHVIDYYLNLSHDFNGLSLLDAGSDTAAAAAEELVREGLIQVVTGEDWMNPHIRPWASRRDLDSQVTSLASSDPVCLYPTPAALADTEPREPTPDQPYTTRLARGGGSLELAYFRFDVLEAYRNDPRFDFDFDDFGARCATSTATYEDASEPGDDKTSISEVGYAYDTSTIDPSSEAPITRSVCAFLHDLHELTPLHQQRWKTYEIMEPSANMRPHPMWWGRQMGHWLVGLGPFSRFFLELETWNELHQRVYDESLFRTLERPRELGWVLRPSKAEFDQFVHLLDKLLSENLRHQAFDELGIDAAGPDGTRLGTLRRLELLLLKLEVDPVSARKVLHPLRAVRKDRQGPAHKLSENITNRDFVRRQARLLREVNQSLVTLRELWATHPRNRDWQPSPELEAAGYWL